MDDARRCTAKAKHSGRRCKKAAVTGATVCATHGGAAPQVKAAAKHRAARMEAHAQAERMVARAGVDADPIQHLLDSLYRAAALVEVWGGMVADLDNAAEIDLRDRPGGLRGEVWFEAIEIETSNAKGETVLKKVRVPKADRLLAFNRDGLVTTHPFVDEYQRAIERRAKFAKLALDAGVAERQVQLAEQQARMVADVIRRTLDDPELGLTDTQKQAGVKRAAAHLRLIDGGQTA